MLFMPVPFMRGFGLGGLLIPLVSVARRADAAARAALPGSRTRLDRVRLIPTRRRRRGGPDPSAASGAARARDHAPAGRVSRDRRRAAARARGRRVLALAAHARARTQGSRRTSQAVHGLNMLGGAVGDGRARADRDRRRHRPRRRRAAARPGGRRAARSPGSAPGSRGRASVALGSAPPYVDPTAATSRVSVVGRHEYGDAAAQEFVAPAARRHRSRPRASRRGERLRRRRPAARRRLPRPPYGAFPWLVLAVLVLTYLLLLRAFRSLLLPLKAIVMNLLSIGAAYGLLVARLQVRARRAVRPRSSSTRSRAGSRSSCSRCSSGSRWTTRCSWSRACARSGTRGTTTRRPSRRARAHRPDRDRRRADHGRGVLGLRRRSLVGLQQFGFGLAVGDPLDVTIVRRCSSRALMELFGRWNWWLPDGSLGSRG